MDSFFTFLKKSLVATVFAMFALVATYIPQDWNKVEIAYAGGGATGGSTEPTQILNNIELVGINISDALSAAYNAITSFATNSLWIKDTVLDGIAWSIAKAVISSMIQSLVSWINSGFKGSPMFVQDLSGFLRDAADRAIGEYIDELGGPLSFLCDPFKLDIQVAVALEYQRIRANNQPAPKCTLSGVLNNIKDFTSGLPGSFSNNGGWEAWFDITSNPTMYTPYGAELAAKQAAYVRILNTKGEEAAKINWGSGFLSSEICEMVHGVGGTTKEECFISQPGKVIQEALSFNLDSGRQSLIQADEINEIIGALMGQLANKAISGAAGLLGLSGGTGHTYTQYGSSYLGTMANETLTLADPTGSMNRARAVQEDYRQKAISYEGKLSTYAGNTANNKSKRGAALAATADTATIIKNTGDYIIKINSLAGQYSSATDPAVKAGIIAEFNSLPLYTEEQVKASVSNWNSILIN